MRQSEIILYITLAAAIVVSPWTYADGGEPEKQGNRIFLVDRTGERWDVTQAVSLGFKPDGFQHGIGRDAILPLDGGSLEERTDRLNPGARVIGVENGTDAHAYVIRRLTLHEIANTRLGNTPIAAAY